MQPHGHMQHGNMPPHINQNQMHQQQSQHFNPAAQHGQPQPGYNMYNQTQPPQQQGQYMNYYPSNPSQNPQVQPQSTMYQTNPSHHQGAPQRYTTQPHYQEQPQIYQQQIPHHMPSQQQIKQHHQMHPSNMPSQSHHQIHHNMPPQQPVHQGGSSQSQQQYNPNMMYNMGQQRQQIPQQHSIPPQIPQQQMKYQSHPSSQNYPYTNQGSLPSPQQPIMNYQPPPQDQFQNPRYQQSNSPYMGSLPQSHAQSQPQPQPQTSYSNVHPTIIDGHYTNIKGHPKIPSNQMGLHQSQPSYHQTPQNTFQQSYMQQHTNISQQPPPHSMPHNLSYQQQQQKLTEQHSYSTSQQQQQPYNAHQQHPYNPTMQPQQQTPHQNLHHNYPPQIQQISPQMQHQLQQQQMASQISSQLHINQQKPIPNVPQTKTTKKERASKSKVPVTAHATVDLTQPQPHIPPVLSSQPINIPQQNKSPPTTSTKLQPPLHQSIIPPIVQQGVIPPTVGQKHSQFDDGKSATHHPMKVARASPEPMMNSPSNTTAALSASNSTSDLTTLKSNSTSLTSLNSLASTTSSQVPVISVPSTTPLASIPPTVPTTTVPTTTAVPTTTTVPNTSVPTTSVPTTSVPTATVPTATVPSTTSVPAATVPSSTTSTVVNEEDTLESFSPYSHFYSCLRLLIYLVYTISNEKQLPENLSNLNVHEYQKVINSWINSTNPSPLKHYTSSSTSSTTSKLSIDTSTLDGVKTTPFNTFAKNINKIFQEFLSLLQKLNYYKLENEHLVKVQDSSTLSSSLIEFCQISLPIIIDIDEKCQKFLFRYSSPVVIPSTNTNPTSSFAAVNDATLASIASSTSSVNSYGFIDIDIANDTVISLPEVDIQSDNPSYYPSTYPQSLKDSMDEAIKLFPLPNFYEGLRSTYDYILDLPLPVIIPPSQSSTTSSSLSTTSNLNDEINSSLTVYSRLMQWPSSSDTPFLGVANIS